MNSSNELPNLFQFDNGNAVIAKSDWPNRRQEILQTILNIQYGQLPPNSGKTKAELLHTTQSHLLKAKYQHYRILPEPDQQFGFTMSLLTPLGDGPFPVIIDGDACWSIRSDEIISAILEKKYMFALFNRVEIVPDNGSSNRISGLHRLYPQGDYGSVAAWAWGYHRCLDFLLTLDTVAKDKIAAVGASRGGKAALLAGATDERITLTAPNESGCSGAGCYRHQGEGSETLKEMIEGAGHWLSPKMREFVGHVERLPFDQHFLKALVAPRALLTTEALGDLYANPTGTWHTHEAAREAYRFLGVENKIGINFREGLHDHTLADWLTFLDFAEWQFRGIKPTRLYNDCPFPNLPKAFTWSMPSK